MDDIEISPQLYSYEDQTAVGHVFSVAAALDSPVIGEPQVNGQIRDSHFLGDPNIFLLSWA